MWKNYKVLRNENNLKNAISTIRSYNAYASLDNNHIIFF